LLLSVGKFLEKFHGALALKRKAQQFKVYPVSRSEYMKTTSSCQLPKRLRRMRTRSSLKNSSLLRTYALAFR